MHRTRTAGPLLTRSLGLATLIALGLIALGLTAGPAHAQDVIPPANATTYGNNLTFVPLAPYPYTFQIDYDASQLGALSSGTVITSLGYRLANGQTTNPTLNFTTYSVELSQSLNPVGSLSTTFADNIGPDATTVYDAPLTVAAGALVPGTVATPGPFYSIAFATPYTYTGGDLLITLRSSGSSSALVGLDANTVDSSADTVAALSAPGSDTATSGQAEFYFYPIVSLGVQPASTTPEPSPAAALGLGALGVLGLLARARRRKSA